ncbi:sigma-70 region 4 domain-containing protein [Streptomyces sp. NPDC055796]
MLESAVSLPTHHRPAPAAQQPSPAREQAPGHRPHVPADTAMHVSYEAFCARYRPLYIRYAAVRLSSAGCGARLADRVLDALAPCWSEALACPSPAATVWETFTSLIETAAERGTRCVRALPCRQADAVILRHRLGLPAETAAELMGISDSAFRALHRAALRTLATPK